MPKKRSNLSVFSLCKLSEPTASRKLCGGAEVCLADLMYASPQ